MALLSSCLQRSIKPTFLGNLNTLFNSLHMSPRSQQSTKTLDKLPGADFNPSKTAQDYQNIFRKVNDNLSSPESHGRLFAVVHLCGKQFKVTSGDIIVVEGYWPPTVSDRIHLEKVLLVGGNNFTLFGRPILESGLVDVQATIIEKTLSHTKTHFKKKRRKQYTRINFQRSPHTMLRINSVDIVGKVNESAKGINSVNLF
ncbi:39S ribosomal protein L21, mitochondrial [Episyrphus balteatus]|uniref:39S ribosomal protein L21, mitochondrial n=1 Tax=Episyrphus balteatus TaxID=286459 RepID=UPI0024866939|nr:39S ribosomal protein L21, mitochondrial [Episyrphus balteatus]